jgi:membrane-associated phospholipid phosphatase
MQIIWQFITDLGDSSITVTLAGFILIYLLTWERWRQAMAWTLAVAVCALGTAMVKLLYHSCIMVTAAANLSGHAAMSATVYGGFALLLTTRPMRWPGYAANAAAGLLVLGISLSRIALEAHQWSEVLAGLIVGLATVLLFRRMSGPGERPVPVAGLLIGAVVMAALMHGFRWPVERYLTDLAMLIHNTEGTCAQL